jgi:ABC-2 type transport system permease protein
MKVNVVSRFKGLGAFAATETRVQFHEYLSIASSILVQIIFIFFMWLLAPRSLLPFALVGSTVFSSFVIGERILDEAAYIRIDHKLNELYHASPMSPESYFLGMSLGVLAAYLPPLIFLAWMSNLVHPFSAVSALVLLGALVGVWAFAASVGYALSTLFKDMRAIWPYATLIFNLFGVLPPVFYPLYIFPAALQPVALAMPPSAAAALVMHSMNLLSLSVGEIVLATLAICVETLAAFLFAVYWSRRFSREE